MLDRHNANGRKNGAETGRMVVEDRDNMTFRVKREVFVSPDILFDEQETIFDKCWIYVGHESEVPHAGDYRSRTVAGRPMILVRGDDSVVRVLLNTCTHRGAMVCRSGENFNGPWGAPAMYALEGGSLGFQLDREATDLVLLIMTHRGADSILNGKIKLGGDASVAAGPKGGEAQLATDAYMGAEILSYSRSRGLFAGISLQGSTLRPDDEASEQIYGRKITAKDIVLGKEIVIPVTGRHLVHVLQKNAPRNESIQASMRANP